MAITFFGERRVAKLSELKVGDMVKVYATVKSRSGDDQGERWYTTVDGSTIVVLLPQKLQEDVSRE